jgi:hypothetical protein
LIAFFLQGIDAEKYIFTHMYGEVERVDDMGDSINQSALLQDFFNADNFTDSIMNRTGFDQTFIKKKNLVAHQTAKIQKMTAFQTYLALIKGYCGACVLFTPKAFANGGWFFSIVAIILSGWFTTICALKLIRLGVKMDCYSYSEIVKKSFGKNGRFVLDIGIFLSQYSFTIGSIAFQTSTLKDLVVYYYYGAQP